jgi:hypothetical protein
MKLADTFAPWLQQSPVPASNPREDPQVGPIPDPDMVQGNVVTLNPDPRPFHDDAREPDTEPWHCRHCEQPVDIHEVFIAPDGRTLTKWRCEPCQVVAVPLMP